MCWQGNGWRVKLTLSRPQNRTTVTQKGLNVITWSVLIDVNPWRRLTMIYKFKVWQDERSLTTSFIIYCGFLEINVLFSLPGDPDSTCRTSSYRMSVPGLWTRRYRLTDAYTNKGKEKDEHSRFLGATTTFLQSTSWHIWDFFSGST